MGRPKKGEENSQTPRAIAARALRREAKAARAAGEHPPPDEISTEQIGVNTPPKPEKPLDDESAAQTYHCENCRGVVLVGDARCPICEQTLNWEGIE